MKDNVPPENSFKYYHLGEAPHVRVGGTGRSPGNQTQEWSGLQVDLDGAGHETRFNARFFIGGVAPTDRGNRLIAAVDHAGNQGQGWFVAATNDHGYFAIRQFDIGSRWVYPQCAHQG